jgi:hypothetical protein
LEWVDFASIEEASSQGDLRADISRLKDNLAGTLFRALHFLSMRGRHNVTMLGPFGRRWQASAANIFAACESSNSWGGECSFNKEVPLRPPPSVVFIWDALV